MVVVSFTAEYVGECTSCSEDIKPGQQINSTGRGYVHAVCPEPVPDPVTPVCRVCFLELPTTGVCGVCDE